MKVEGYVVRNEKGKPRFSSSVEEAIGVAEVLLVRGKAVKIRAFKKSFKRKKKSRCH